MKKRIVSTSSIYRAVKHRHCHLIINQYCQDENIDIIFEVPDDRRIAEAYSVGKMIIDVLPEYKEEFAGLYESVSKRFEG